jgi:serine/threonine protein kinase
MTAINTQCPPASLLADFGLGKLDAASAETISQHLETCADCRQHVARLSGDSFVDLLREAHDPANAESRSLASPQVVRGPGDVGSDAQKAALATPGGSAENGTDMPVAFGRYQVTQLLGQGGFGVVYLGHDPELRRTVAIKVPRRDRVSSPADTEAYLAEARLLAALVHPGIVPVHDFGRTDDGLCYVVSEHIPGGDLGTLLAQRRLPVEEAVELAAQIAEALHHAHRHGLVHRDIKPGNILLDRDGHPLVADFGLALTDESYGRSPGVFGTPAYMSPEQARGESHRVDARSDIYSLGVLFYEMLAGRRPYRRSEARELLDEISSGDVRPPRQLDHTIPQELERICLKALGHHPADRYTTAFDMADDLRRWQSRGETAEVEAADSPAARRASSERGREKSAVMPWRNFKLLIGCGGLLTLSVTSTVALLVVTVLQQPRVQLAQNTPNDAAHIESRPLSVEATAPPPNQKVVDPWQTAKEAGLAAYRLLAVEDPKIPATWPFFGAAIIGPHTLLTTADVGVELAKFRAGGMNISILRDSQDTGVLADRVRIHAAFQKAERDERPFFDMALLTTTERLDGAATFASDAELAAIERGRPLVCVATDHSGEPINRFWPLLPERQIGKVFAVTRLSSDTGAPRVLHLRGAFSDKSPGSPIFNERAELIAIYCDAVGGDKNRVPESAQHFAKVIEPELIELGISQAENPLWVAPATAGRQDSAGGVQPRALSSVAALSNQIYLEAQALRATANAYTAIGIARQANATAASMEMDDKVKWVSTYFERRRNNRQARAAERPPYIDREEKRQEMYRRLMANNLSASSGDLTDELNWMLREILANTSYMEFMSDTPNSMVSSEYNAPLSATERHEIQLSEGKVAVGGGMKFPADGEVLETAWPPVLRDDRFQAARKAFEDARDWAVADLKNDNEVTKAGADRLMAAVDRLTSELTKAYPRKRLKTLSPRDGLDYLAGKRFVQSLAESTFRLIETNSALAFDDSYRFRGKNVAELMQHLMSRGLQFARPEKGGEPTYRKLYDSIRGFYLKIVPFPNQ